METLIQMEGLIQMQGLIRWRPESDLDPDQISFQGQK